MGSTGAVSNNLNEFFEFTSQYNKYPTEVLAWYREHSNIAEWYDSLTDNEREAINDYVGSGYREINSRQYNVPWEEMSGKWKKKISDLYHVINRFELKDGVTVDRACNFQVFGAGKGETMTVKQIQDFLKQSDGYMQNDGFMSFSQREDGYPVGKNYGVVIKLNVPPSTGAGAYIGAVSPLSGEQEFVLNNNSILKYDINSVRKRKDGTIVVNADWIGRSEAQTISPTYTGNLQKKGGATKPKNSWLKKFLFND